MYNEKYQNIIARAKSQTPVQTSFTQTFTSNTTLTTQNARADIIGELEAIIQYQAHFDETTDESARETIADIMKEEKLHVGQLFGLLFSLDEEAKTQFEKGLHEFNSTK